MNDNNSNNNKDQLDMSDLAVNLPAAAAGEHSDVLESLTPNVRKRVEALQQIQGQHDDLESNFFEERAALEAKYQKLYEPLYTKRYEIVNGVVEVEGVVVNEAKPDQGEENAAEEKGVPNFWLTALKTNEVLSEEITERDEGALKYLKDIKWTRIDEPKGFKLEFFFESNPYFKNTVLTKTYHMIDEDEPILEKAIGTEIEWLPGKCLTQKILKKKPKKGSKNSKPITKTENCESFFNFFNPPQVPEDEEDIDDDAAEELQNLMEQDYEIGHHLGLGLRKLEGVQLDHLSVPLNAINNRVLVPAEDKNSWKRAFYLWSSLSYSRVLIVSKSSCYHCLIHLVLFSPFRKAL
ncbi:hypothetical protein KSS87_008936 [Heliosperma pusillum]|nr:hypothetical protein KSS87_008936 [Heliosperma pusillum]